MSRPKAKWGTMRTSGGSRVVVGLALGLLASVLTIAGPAAADRLPGATGRSISPASAAPASDALWVYNNTGAGQSPSVCVNPSGGCSLPAPSAPTGSDSLGPDMITSDGVYVYAVQSGTSPVSVWVCPIDGYGSGCSFVTLEDTVDGWQGQAVSAAAAIDVAGQVGPAGASYLFVATTGSGNTFRPIYRCPVAVAGSFDCVQLDNGGNREADSMVVGNGYLWAGINRQTVGPFEGPQTIVWQCSLWQANACGDFDTANSPFIYSLAVGGGYLWAGRSDGVIWRCSMSTPSPCADWDAAGSSAGIAALSYDGAGTLYAAVATSDENHPAVLWSCTTAYANGCTAIAGAGGNTSLYEVYNVEAGAGGVFNVSMWKDGSGIHNLVNFGAVGLSAVATSVRTSQLLYVPAGGFVAPGAARVVVPLPPELASQCAAGGSVPGVVSVSGPYGMRLEQGVDLCGTGNPTYRFIPFGSLDPGQYTFMVRSGVFVFTGSAPIVSGATDVTLVQSEPVTPVVGPTFTG